jgi:hypothetical protein
MEVLQMPKKPPINPIQELFQSINPKRTSDQFKPLTRKQYSTREMAVAEMLILGK